MYTNENIDGYRMIVANILLSGQNNRHGGMPLSDIHQELIHTGYNPTLLVHTLYDMAESGHIEQDKGFWHLTEEGTLYFFGGIQNSD